MPSERSPSSLFDDSSNFIRMSIGVGHSPQTRSFAPAAPIARVRLRNILQGLALPPPRTKSVEPSLLAHCVGWHQNYFLRKRPSFLVSRRFAQENPTPCSNDLFRLIKMCG
jgi:hypothetical protein